MAPKSFPVSESYSDVLEGSATQTVIASLDVGQRHSKMSGPGYPSTLADLQKGLDALLRKPSGCFEQTSTSNYPNLLILNY